MRTLSQHIEYVKGQPHHVRKQVAIAAAAGGTALVALVWLVGSITTGAFAIGNTPAASAVTTGGDVSGNQNLAGAGAAAALPQTDVTPAHIEIIDAAPAAGAASKKPEQTTIPF